MVLNKRGDFKYDTIGSLILGLLILGIVMYWIFSVYFTADDIDWEVCRESLIIRNSLPERELGVMISTKGALDLKCKTRTVTIDYEDVERAEKIIGETISSCWYMIGRGEYKVFPGVGNIDGLFVRKATPCIMCARIHMDSEVKEFYSKEENKINLKRTMNSLLEGYEVSVWDYLNPSRGAQAFTYFNEWNDEGFNISFAKDIIGIGFNPDTEKIFSLPRYMDPDKGDLFIGYSEPVRETFATDERMIDPYMILLQYEDFDKLSYGWAGTLESRGGHIILTPETCESCIKVCSSIETVPS